MFTPEPPQWIYLYLFLEPFGVLLFSIKLSWFPWYLKLLTYLLTRFLWKIIRIIYVADMLKYNPGVSVGEWGRLWTPSRPLSGFKKVLRDGWRGSGLSIFGFEEKRQKKGQAGLKLFFKEVLVWSFFSPFVPHITVTQTRHPTWEACWIWRYLVCLIF